MSENTQKLSLFSAIFININIMLGSGIFINSAILAKQSGLFGAVCYLIVGILMLPLIISISKLVALHPSGGFYTFGSKEISPFIGFVGTWSYIIGKLASATIITQIAVLLLQQTIPILSTFNPLLLNGCIMSTFIWLNMLDIHTNKTIQSYFLGLKLIPILFGIFISLYLFSPSNIHINTSDILNIPLSLPLVVFAIAGFEAACSLSSKIKDASKNAPRVILISYGFVILATTLFQFMIYGALGNALGALPDYRALFPTLIHHALPPMHALQLNLVNIFHLAIAASALGGSYGIIFSNNWNIYTLAQHKHLIASNLFTKLNKHGIPWLCVIAEGIIYLLFLITSRGNQIPLQQMGALGTTIAYTISALALCIAVKKRPSISIAPWIPKLAFGNCLLLIAAAIYSFFMNGMGSLFLFSILLAIGCMIFLIQNRSSYFNRNERQET